MHKQQQEIGSAPKVPSKRRFSEMDQSVYLLRLPTQVHQLLLKAQDRANQAQLGEDDVQLGEVRFDPNTNQGSLLIRRELDPQKKRWVMRLDIKEEEENKPCSTMGIMTESRTNGTLKLQTMVDSRVACIAKNYSIDEKTKLSINDMDKQKTMEYDVPNDPLDPVFISRNGTYQSNEYEKDSDESDSEGSAMAQYRKNSQ